MARRSGEQAGLAGPMLEDICNAGAESLPQEERLALLAGLRQSGMETGERIDQLLLERIWRQREALLAVEEEHGKLRELLGTLTAPPYFPAIFLDIADTPEVQGAMVQTDEGQRVVQVAEDIDVSELAPGDEVFLTHERNCVIAKSPKPCFITGEVAAFSRRLDDGRIVLRSRDEEFVVRTKASLDDAGLKAGDGVRFNRNTGMGLEQIESAKGEEYFMESTPADTFSDIGGLDREIEQLKEVISLHIFHPEIADRYRMRPRRSILMEGPPGNGKTKIARATCNWLAGLATSGRSRLINVKPGALNSLWFGETERKYREIFRIAKEAADSDPRVPVVMFWDEVDAIGGIRGESVHRIDDRLLNAFMAELSGLEDRGNVIVLSATNRLDSLDPALLRSSGRLGDLVLHIPRPKACAARAILGRHLRADIPYASNGEGAAAAREALLDQAIGQLFAQNLDTELARITLRDGKRRVVRAADLVSGAALESIAQGAVHAACSREASGGPGGVCSADISAAIADFFVAAPRALAPRNARNYLQDLPQDVDVVSVDLIERKVANPHRYRLEVA
jgi:proteasome-associated ATPase